MSIIIIIIITNASKIILVYISLQLGRLLWQWKCCLRSAGEYCSFHYKPKLLFWV